MRSLPSFPALPSRRRWLLATAVATPLLLAGAALFALQGNVTASSHREAPLISKDAFADNTDTYVFISPESDDNVVMVAGWIPFEGPEGGPNYWSWDDTALYDIYVDNDGDARSDITYTLSSRSVIANPGTFLYNTGPINSLADTDWNLKQYYTVTEETEAGAVTVLLANKLAPPVNIGEKSTPNYAALEGEAIYDSSDGLPAGMKIFAGQTDDPFFVDLQVFDLLTLRGQAPPIGYNANNLAIDSLSGFNIHSLIIETPISRVKAGADPVIGVWSGTRRPSLTVLAADGTANTAYKQISRLGMPLVNEVVIPLGLKDAFNTIAPSVDLSLYGLLQEYVENPMIGRLLCGIYSVPLPEDSNDDCNSEFTATPASGRSDLFQVFLTGMTLANPFTITTAGGPVGLPAGYKVNVPAAVTPAEMIRINTDVKGTLCSPEPSRLGVLGGDACGFPNGRRLTDDIVEIELLAVAGAAYPVLDGSDSSFSFNPALIGVLTDGVDQNDMAVRDTFPYVPMAQSGQAHWHTNPFFNVLMPWVNRSK